LLLTLIAAMESVNVVRADEKLTAFMELEAAIGNPARSLHRLDDM
jgi:hypothetical protein